MPRSPRPNPHLPCLGLAFVVAACSSGPQHGVPASLLPKLALVDTQGQTFDPSSLAGKPVLVNFWSVNCSACIHEMPALQAAVDETSEAKPAALVTIVIDGTPGRAEATARHNGIRAPVLLAPRSLVTELRIRQVPTTIVVAPSGQTARVLIGERSKAGFIRALEEL